MDSLNTFVKQEEEETTTTGKMDYITSEFNFNAKYVSGQMFVQNPTGFS